jgi:hypothetical protein
MIARRSRNLIRTLYPIIINDSLAGAWAATGANVKLFAVGSTADLNATGVRAINNAEVRFLNGAIGHSSVAATTTATGGTITTTGTVFMP